MKGSGLPALAAVSVSSISMASTSVSSTSASGSSASGGSAPWDPAPSVTTSLAASALLAASLLLAASPARAADVCAAADLVRVSTLLGGAPKRNAPAEPQLDKAAGITGSGCQYLRDRATVVLLLIDYKSPADASRQMASVRLAEGFDIGNPKLTEERAAGADQAALISGDAGALAFVVRRGARVTMAGNGGAPLADTAVRRENLRALAIGAQTAK